MIPTNENRIILNKNDILYICISTEQNIINLYPVTYYRQKLIEGGKIYSLIISTARALEHWTPKLEKLLSNTLNKEKYNLTFQDDDSIFSISDKIKSLIFNNYKLDSNTRIVMNYGGGLKTFSLALGQVANSLTYNINLVYPNKQSNKMYITEYVNTKMVNQIDVPLKIDFSTHDIFSLFIPFGFEPLVIYSSIDSNKVDKKLEKEINLLPELYDCEDYANLLFELSSFKDFSELNNITAEQLFNQLEDKNYKKQVLDSISKSFNGENCDIQLDDRFSIESRTTEDQVLKKGVYKDLANKLKNLFFSRSHYVSKAREIEFSEKANNNLAKLNLCPLTVKNDHFQHQANIIQNMFATNWAMIKNHGNYFEYYCLKLIYNWAKTNSMIVNEVLFNSTITSTIDFKKDSQFDIILSMKNEDIYIIECKTFSYSREKLLSHFTRARRMAGVFTKYIILVPPLPSRPHLKQKIEKAFKDISDQVIGESDINILQVSSNPMPEFTSLDHWLRSIIN